MAVKRITFRGVTHTRTEWARITGIPAQTIWDRLNGGWSIEKALTEKPKRGRPRKHSEEWDGTVWMRVSNDDLSLPEVVADSVAELSKKCGTSENVIYASINHYKNGRIARERYVRVRI